MANNRVITTDKTTFNKYVGAGLWQPEGTPKYYSFTTAVVAGRVKLARRRGDTEDRFDAATIYIQNFYSRQQLGK